jgi:hypothetical protein
MPSTSPSSAAGVAPELPEGDDEDKATPAPASSAGGRWLRGVFSSFLASLVEPVDDFDAAANALAQIPLAGELSPPPPPRQPPSARRRSATEGVPSSAPAAKHAWAEAEGGLGLSRRWRATFDEFALCLERYATSELGRGHDDVHDGVRAASELGHDAMAPADSLFLLLSRLEAASGRGHFGGSVRSEQQGADANCDNPNEAI